MKTRNFLILLIAFAITSCAKEQLEVQKVQMPEELVLKMKTHTVIDASSVPESSALYTRPDFKCLDGSCAQAALKFKNKFQKQANETCATIWGEETCCINDQVAYVIIIVRPKSTNCYKMDETYQYAILKE